MNRFFLYPSKDSKKGSPNPYIENFQRALSKRHIVVNGNAPHRGVLNLFLYFLQTEVFILNWVENFPEKRMGNLQTFLFKLFLNLAKISNKKIVWILHNKGSHHKKDKYPVRIMFDMLVKFSNQIITHSNAGLDFVKDHYPGHVDKVRVLVHPITELFPFTDNESGKKYDFIIWGSIFRYKGIDDFLKYLNNNKKGRHFKVLIVGKCFDPNYEKELRSLLTDNIHFDNQLYDLDQIAAFSCQARFTLFTYKSETVLSSGSLMDAIRMGAIIIGPDHGAFKDLAQYPFVHTYTEFEDIFDIHKNYQHDIEKDKNSRVSFFLNNNWSNFIDKVASGLNT